MVVHGILYSSIQESSLHPKRPAALLISLPNVAAFAIARDLTSSRAAPSCQIVVFSTECFAKIVEKRRPEGSRPAWKLLALLFFCLVQPALCRSQDATAESAQQTARPSKLPDVNTDIYYRNKLEFSLDTGGLPINIPFAFDVFEGGDYSQKPLHYTLVPIFPSLRWQMGNVRGPWILRGNTDLTVSLSVTAIPRGPEKVYGAFDLGVRRNFVYRNWKATPYFEFRTGAGFIDAQQPHGVQYAQGEDYTFTLWLGAGFRYNFSPKWSMSLGPTYMHVSNLYLSEPRYEDTGINVVGGVVGFNVRLGRPKKSSAH